MSVFYPSLELRWFFESAVPAEVEAWFMDADRPEVSRARRTDRYLYLPGQDTVGVKLREGRIEIKHRLGPPAAVSFGDRIRGRVERWRKWSFDLGSEAGFFDPDRYPASSWVPVTKERLLCTYRDDAKHRFIVLPSYAADLERGCDLECTRVEAAGEAWWSLGFEAFGPEDELAHLLLAVARRVLADPPPAVLTEAGSYSYPHWLTQLPAVDELDPPGLSL